MYTPAVVTGKLRNMGVGLSREQELDLEDLVLLLLRGPTSRDGAWELMRAQVVKANAERDRAVELLRRVVDLVDDRYVDSTAFAGVVAMIASDARAFFASLDRADQ